MRHRAFQDRLAKRARRAGLVTDVDLFARLEAYFELLARWNAKINLTAFNLADPNDEAIDRLLIEPLVAAQHLPPGTRTIIDIGSGSGSPAIPLKLAAPQVQMTMVEAKTRKAVFLLEALRHLSIFDAAVETARFEELLTRPELHEANDVLTVRAVRVETRTLLSLQAFLRPGGCLFWFRRQSRTDAPKDVPYPLEWARTVPLVEELGSRLVILSKSQR